MREILFRGKRTDNGEWIEGYFGAHTKLDVFIIQKPYPRMDTGDLAALGFYKVIPETVGQYTGLTDKNGKKIFEGDIVERYERQITSPHNLYPTEKAEISWDSNFTQFSAETIDVYQEKENLGEFIQGCQVEIIGNIHDNPELLEVKQ